MSPFVVGIVMAGAFIIGWAAGSQWTATRIGFDRASKKQ